MRKIMRNFWFRAREIALGDEGYFTFYWLNGEHKIGRVQTEQCGFFAIYNNNFPTHIM
jgi:hypothetical protein